jgi:hypothetical protein
LQPTEDFVGRMLLGNGSGDSNGLSSTTADDDMKFFLVSRFPFPAILRLHKVFFPDSFRKTSKY